MSAAVTCALDAWAIITVARRQTGAETVRDAIDGGGAVVSWINLGEVFYVLARDLGDDRAQKIVDAACLDARAEVPSGRSVLDAARLRTRGGLSFADCFAVTTAQRHAVPLLTGDPEIVALAGELQVIDLRERP